MTDQPDQVPAQLDDLAKQDPTDPDLDSMRLRYLLTDPEKNIRPIQAVYAHLKEDTARELSLKAFVAREIKDNDEALRLLKLSTEKDPKNLGDWISLARLQYQIGKKDDAVATANRGLEANPGNPQLRLMIPALEGEDVKQIRDVQVELAKENPDKVQGELMEAGVAQRSGDSASQLAHLKAAEAIAPNSGRVLEGLFYWYMDNKDYKSAATYVPKLANVDFDHVGGALYELQLAEAQDDHASAEAIARKLVQDHPEYPRSWLALGEVLKNEGNYVEAVPQYANSIQKQSTLIEAYIGLARCYYNLQKPDDALHTLEDGLQKNPGDEQLQHMKLMHLMNYGKPEVAVKEIEDEINARSSPPPELFAYLTEVVLRYAEMLKANHQPQDAVVEAEYVINALKPEMAKWPNEPTIFVSMAKALMEAGRQQDALQILQQWADRPDWKAKPNPYIALSDYYEQTGDHDKAEAELHDALAKSGYQADLQIQLASLMAMHHKFDDALQLLRAVNTDKPAVRERLIQVMLVAGQFKDAEAQLKADLVGNPPDAPQLLTTWALALYERGDYTGAEDRATQALAINPNNQTALYCRGRARLHTKPPAAADALQDLDLFRQSNPNDVEVRMYMADAHMMLNQGDEAVADLTVALRAEPLNKAVRFKLVDLDLKASHPRFSEALQLLQDVETTPPFDKDPDVFENEAIICGKMGNSDDALAKSQTALQLAPDNETVLRTNLQILEDRKDDQGVIDRYSSLNDKYKRTSWALWTLADAEKHLNLPQALDDFKKALAAARADDDPPTIDYIARDIGKQFGYDEAIADVLPMSNDYISAKLTLAHMYQAKGQDVAALSTMDDLMVNFSALKARDQLNVLTNAALMYQVAKPPRADKAYETYKRWLQLDPDNIEALNNMACLLADDFSPPRAQEGLQYINRAIGEMSSLGRTEPRLLDTQAWLMILNGSAEDGVNILNNVVIQDLDPIPEEYLHLGEGYLRLPVPDPVQAETQANQGLHLLDRRNTPDQDADLRAKLKDLVNRSEAMKKANSQKQVP
jgi:tetratricopeptide (TPR) repeat protein